MSDINENELDGLRLWLVVDCPVTRARLRDSARVVIAKSAEDAVKESVKERFAEGRATLTMGERWVRKHHVVPIPIEVGVELEASLYSQPVMDSLKIREAEPGHDEG